MILKKTNLIFLSCTLVAFSQALILELTGKHPDYSIYELWNWFYWNWKNAFTILQKSGDKKVSPMQVQSFKNVLVKAGFKNDCQIDWKTVESRNKKKKLTSQSTVKQWNPAVFRVISLQLQKHFCLRIPKRSMFQQLSTKSALSQDSNFLLAG